LKLDFFPRFLATAEVASLIYDDHIEVTEVTFRHWHILTELVGWCTYLDSVVFIFRGDRYDNGLSW